VGVPERRARRKSQLRQEILDAASEILVRDGYEGLTMRKVAQRIDYSATTIYLYFKDRDELVFYACEQFLAGLLRELQETVARIADPAEALRKILRRYVEYGLAHPQQYLATFVIPHAHTPEADARYKQPDAMSMKSFGFLEQLVREVVRRKRLARVDVEAASRALWAGAHGITSLLLVIPTFEWGRTDRVIDQLVSQLVDGLLAPGPRMTGGHLS
jgi:AcrR family transcriptional regulator